MDALLCLYWRLDGDADDQGRAYDLLETGITWTTDGPVGLTETASESDGCDPGSYLTETDGGTGAGQAPKVWGNVSAAARLGSASVHTWH